SGVEGGVEEGHLWHLGEQGPGGGDGGQGAGLVQRGQVGQRLDLREHRLVNDRGLRELCAAVDDAVADGRDLALGRQEVAELVVVGLAVPVVDGQRGGDLVGRVEQRELEAARPGGDDQDATH